MIEKNLHTRGISGHTDGLTDRVVSGNKQTGADFLSQRLRINIDIAVPGIVSLADYASWGKLLTGSDCWLSADSNFASHVASGEALPDWLRNDECVFLASFLALFRQFLELGRIPVFDDPVVRSLQLKDPDKRIFAIVFDILKIDFLHPAAYQQPVKMAVNVCQWMTQHAVSPDNRAKVFNTIDQQVIQVLNNLIPKGKSTIPVLKVAHALGIPYRHLGLGTYQLGWGSKARRLDRSTTEIDSAIGAKLAQNKVVTANLLRVAGLPAPVHAVVASEADAMAAAERIGFPVVVKPIDRDRGEGLSVDVVGGESLKASFAHAHRLAKSKQVIIERQVDGVCHRIFIANGHLLYAVKRWPMSVRGDGKRSIAQLVHDELAEQALKAPWSRSEMRPIDVRALAALALAGFSPESIPANGTLAPLRRIESSADGGVDEEVTTMLHPENVAAAIDATRLFGLHVAGIDIISPDITKPWHKNGAIINEVNFAPLFGGGEISRSHISRFFSDFIEGDGKIPIEVVGSEDAALKAQRAYGQRGSRCYFTSNNKTIDCFGNPVMMPFDDVRQRLKALIMRADADVIVVSGR